MGLVEKIFKGFSPYKSMRAIDHHGALPFCTQGIDWQDLSGGALAIATY